MAREENGSVAAIYITSFENEFETEDSFDQEKKQYTEDVLEGSEILNNSSIKIAGCSAQVAYFKLPIKSENKFANSNCVFVYHNQKLLHIMFAEYDRATYDYFNDYLKILESMQETNESDTPVPSAISITGCRLAETYAGKKVLVVSYEFTNNFSENKIFSTTFTDKAFQNGVELKNSYFVKDVDTGASIKEVQPGGTIKVECAYEITDQSNVTIEIRKLYHKEPYFTQEISLN